jgi:hypothetical protein
MRLDVRQPAMVLLLTLRLGLAGFALDPAPVWAMPRSMQDAAPQGPDDGRLPLLGKITGVHDSALEVMDTNGETVSVKLNGQTQFRKDRQPAKRSDFKVGDIIIVRGDENADHSWTAQVVAARSVNGPNGPNGRGGPGRESGRGFGQAGTLGKDFVAGEIKSVDAPKLLVLRSDNVMQTLELNEETSLRKGRDSITMADVQVGDHLFARGGVENDVFVPKMVMVIGPEQWKRMQEMGAQARGEGEGQRRRQSGAGGADAPAAPANPNAPAPATAPKPQEPRH